MAVRKAVADLLRDREATGPLPTVQGLLAGLDRQAVPALIDLVLEPPGELSWRVEELLGRLAGEQPPPLPSGDDAAARQKRRDAWSRWWKENGAGINLARLQRTAAVPGHHSRSRDARQQGLGVRPRRQGPVGTRRAAMSHRRPGAAGRPGARRRAEWPRVTERDRAGKVLWEQRSRLPSPASGWPTA